MKSITAVILALVFILTGCVERPVEQEGPQILDKKFAIGQANLSLNKAVMSIRITTSDADMVLFSYKCINGSGIRYKYIGHGVPNEIGSSFDRVIFICDGNLEVTVLAVSGLGTGNVQVSDRTWEVDYRDMVKGKKENRI